MSGVTNSVAELYEYPDAVITRFPVPLIDTAQNRPSEGAQQIEFQLLSAADARIVHKIPSVLVITRLPVPVFATAQNRPSEGAQQTETQKLSAADFFFFFF